ncbi:YxeA family protein [Companilactobacillus mishanensis]|uniref:YxeA family protein n=1 Tax=Companilactobacillus mishanensis TaxID=2486008 RepID=A0A5P0ZIF5_9LACO|nr:YxeA family protein [Companilactobacillus mishanensis]MQS45570.1 YxeA family protein [Companilactobacillus mishanensis]MQS52871.1 YxeA family protein [Companilactobacillus mishanensis]MQS89876.1 YxeA family protein [Companilactobacillus mishanensis]
MKSLLKFLLLSVLIVGGAYLGACAYTKDRTDQFSQALGAYNILVKRESRYVKIDNSKGHDEDGYGNYDYDLTSYDKDGNPHQVKFTGMGKLKQGHFLKLDTKGAYVYTYDEAFKRNIPSAAYNKLIAE